MEKLKDYLETNPKREKPPVYTRPMHFNLLKADYLQGYDKKAEVLTPYRPDDEHPDIKWIGRRKENYHRTMEGLPYLGL